jgi:hypothetical protein
VKLPEDAAYKARKALKKIARGFRLDEQGMQLELDCLTQLRVAVEERIHQLQQGVEISRQAQARLATWTALSHDDLLEAVKATQEEALELQEALLAAVGDTEAWIAKWRWLCADFKPYALPRRRAPRKIKVCLCARTACWVGTVMCRAFSLL